MLASTAAWPRIRAPIIPIVVPIGEGTLKLASLINSKDISIAKISTIIGNGTDSLDATIANNNSVGIISWWKFVIATYKPGSNKVIKKATNLTNLSKLAYWNLRFGSSAEERKSTKTQGIIKTYGLPFTITTTLPERRWFAALSGLSVESIWGRLHLLLSSINCSNWPEEIIESISKLFNLYFTSATKSSFAISFM